MKLLDIRNQTPKSPKKRRTIHGVSVNTIIASMIITGFALLIVTLLLKTFVVDISWWWVAAAIPIGVHIGPIFIVVAIAVSAITGLLIATFRKTGG